MSQVEFRANTQTSYIPLVSDFIGQTILDARADQTYVPGVNAPDQAVPPDRSVPQLYFAENVMPSVNGFQSVGYQDWIAPPSRPAEFINIFYIPSTVDNRRTYLAQASNGDLYILRDNQWVYTSSQSSPGKISVATVNGVTYVNFEGRGIYTVSVWDSLLHYQSIQGLDDSNILGIAASKGYLLAYSTTGLNWSSTIDPLDFRPSLETGAGGGAIQEAKGRIVHVQESAIGVYIFTEANIVAGSYSGNVNYPWNFRDVQASGGISSSETVVQDTSGQLYCYTSSGLQMLQNLNANTVLPYVTDFISGKIFESFNETTNTITRSYLTDNMRKRLALVADRYLVISYAPPGGTIYNHAIVIDLIQSRQGKIRIPHVQIFERKDLANNQVDIPRDSIGVLQQDGTMKWVDFSAGSSESYGIALFGRYKISRGRRVILDEVILDAVSSPGAISIQSLLTSNGKTITGREEGFPFPGQQGIQRYLFNASEGENLALLIKGAFNISSLIIGASIGGRQ